MRNSLLSASLLASLCVCTASYAQQPELAFSAGIFEIFDSDLQATEIGVEYRFRPLQKAFDLVPAVGFNLNDDGGYWAHAGFRYDFALSEKWLLTPQLALVGYENGGGKNLGSGFLFRSGIELSYKITANNKLAATLYHMSNADLAQNNPGAESLIFTYSYTLQ